MLESRVANCGRHVSRTEIADAVKNALACAWQPRGNAAPVQISAKWPEVNQEQRSAILRDNGGLADLWEASKPRIDDAAQHTEEIINRLFPGNPLLCCGKSNSEFDTKPREDWRGQMSALALIVPSPMSALSGKKKNPKPGESEWSAHTLDNTGTRRFLICEFDTGTADEHAALLLHLGTFAPLVCAVHSGANRFTAGFTFTDSPPRRWKSFFATPFHLARIGQHGHARNLCECLTAHAITANARRFILPTSNHWRAHCERTS